MSYLDKIWQQAAASEEEQQELCSDLEISPILAHLLINRGIKDKEEARNFLFGGYDDQASPFLLKDMKKAVQRIVQAIDNQEKIMIYGDYDVDGITASALTFLVLQKLGARVEYYIPKRDSEGYGLNDAALANIYAAGTTLLITVDSGISAVAEIKESPLDIIVTDHHEPPEELPAAYAIINPKQKDCLYPDKKLAGVGVAFKLCQALGAEYDVSEKLRDYLDLVAVGTIADIVPLVGENHILVKLGLEKLNHTKRYGLQALIAVCGLTNHAIDAGKVAFMLAPRLNAAGRMSNAAIGVELLIAKDKDKAQALAQLLNEENIERQAIEQDILTHAEEVLFEEKISSPKALVIEGDEWHPGVIGIVASRLVDKYYCPVVMISVKDGVGKGSCRSIPGFNIYQALQRCSDLLIKFGGHEQAAGLSINEKNIPDFRARLTELAQNILTAKDYIPKLKIDDFIALNEIHDGLMEQISLMAPFGMGNPSPLFACRKVKVMQKKAIGQQGKHLKLKVKNSQTVGDVVAWNMGYLTTALAETEEIDLAFAPVYNEWNGMRHIQLQAKDIKIAPLRVLDYRNCNNRLALIKNIVKSGKTLIYVATKEETEKIQPLLLPGSLCLTLRSEQIKKNFTNIIMMTPDVSWDSFIKHCYLPAENAKDSIYLLYGENDKMAVQKMLFTEAPGRQEVAAVYLSLRQLADAAGLEKIVQAVRKKWPDFSSEGIKTCLDIMTELDLLTKKDEEYCLGQKPQKKKVLSQSPLFRQCAEIRRNFSEFSQEALTMPLPKLSCYIKTLISKKNNSI